MTPVRSVVADASGAKRSGPVGVLSLLVQGGGLAPAGEVEIWQPVVVAVERGDAAAHEELELTVVAVVDAGRGGVVDEVRHDRSVRRLVACVREREPTGGGDRDDHHRDHPPGHRAGAHVPD